MARRKARRSGKIEPAVKTMTFAIPAEVSSGTVDLSQCASLVNRRFYRQGLNWAVAGFTFFTVPGDFGTIQVKKIPDTWVASNAWEKGMRHWLKMNNEALAETESIKPKFLDFKVYMDDIHHQAGSGTNLIPQDGSAPANVATLGEWDYSQFIIPPGSTFPGATFDREIIWTGASYPGAAPVSTLDAVSLIEGYAASRGLPDILDPNVPDDAADADGNTPENWLAAIFNEGTDQTSDVIENLLTENNTAPYPFENGPDQANPAVPFADTQYPGGANNLSGLQLHDAMPVTATTIGGKTSSGGTNFQGGLIRIDNDLAGEILMLVHLVPGQHRGYMCQPQKDV